MVVTHSQGHLLGGTHLGKQNTGTPRPLLCPLSLACPLLCLSFQDRISLSSSRLARTQVVQVGLELTPIFLSQPSAICQMSFSLSVQTLDLAAQNPSMMTLSLHHSVYFSHPALPQHRIISLSRNPCASCQEA